jgi:predicted membrane-bound spermidine synthase
MKDQSIIDSAHATRVFLVGAMILLFGAVFELNQWPAQSVIKALGSGELSIRDIFVIFNGYGIALIVLFWGSRPSRAAQWAFLFSWPFVCVLFWQKLDTEAHFFQLDSTGFPSILMVVSLLSVAMAIPATVLLGIRLLRTMPEGADPVFEIRLRYLVCLVLLFNLVPLSALSLTAALHPFTFDMYALYWDRAAGLNITPWLIDAVNSIPASRQLMEMAYSMTPLAFVALVLLHLRGKPSHVASGVLAWVGLTICALIAYNLFPITGPKYIFGAADFAAALRHSATLPLEMTGVHRPYPRNGMPSMHFGWMLAATILWWRSGTAWWSRTLLIGMSALTAMATLYTGEHYVVDLIVAIPFVLAAIALCTTAVPWSAAPRRWTILAGFGAWAAWIVILRTFIHGLVAYPWLCWLMIFATAAVVVCQARWMREFAAHVEVNRPKVAAETRDVNQIALERRLGLMFFASGAAALVYQVLFAKQLALVFGSTATATFTVLATFLGGMAIGSLLGGRFALRVNRPLIAYACVELLIAGYCVLTPFLFDLIQHAYVALAAGQRPDASLLLVLRVILGAVVLLVPTILMGATLPLLTQVLGANLRRIGTKVAWLYFANTAGAAAGALMTSYAVIPLLGASRTTLIAAVLNLIVALAAIELAKKAVALQPSTSDEASEFVPSLPKRAATAALLSLGVGGVLSLGLEVVYVHMLSIVAGNSVYAFGLMLATFLIGLAGGGEIARRLLLRQDADRISLLAATLLGLAASVAAGVWWWNDIPEYFASFAKYQAAQSFAAREAIRGLVCALLMIPPTLFVGAAYVFGMDIATSGGRRKPVAMLGIGAALNTLGNITGVLLFGFVLLPQLGGLSTARVIAAAALVLAACVLLMAAKRINRRDTVFLAGAAAMVFTSFGAHLNYDSLSSGANVYFAAQSWGKVTDHAESIDGGLTSVAELSNPQGQVKTLLTNGKFQGNDAWKGEMQAQLGFALASLLHQERRDRALVIGYGTGVTSRVLHEAGFRHLDIAELSRDVVRLADTHFAEMNNRVSSAPGVQLHVTDGRNLLLLTPSQNLYDVVSIEITSIWFAGAASLYNREFYRLARSHMAADGVLQQWLQLHRLSPTDILTVIASLRSEFRYVSLYIIGNQGILIATNSEEHRSPNTETIRMLEKAPNLEKVRHIFDRPISAIAKDRALDHMGIDRFIKGLGVEESMWWSTDNNLSLEYSTPKANVNDAQRSYFENLSLFARFQ